MVAPDYTVRRRENEWDNDSNESFRPSSVRSETAAETLARTLRNSESLHNQSMHHEQNFGVPDENITLDTSNIFGQFQNTSGSYPITFDFSNSSWRYTIMFVLSWILAPVLVIWSKIKRRPAGIHVHSWSRRNNDR